MVDVQYAAMIGDDAVIVAAKCPKCETKIHAAISADQYRRLKAGEHVRDIFPDITADAREHLFMTHICGKCQKEIFEEGNET